MAETAWDGVPWFTGGGAEHSPEVARLLSYAAFGGAEGIIGPGDLRVTEQAVPDGTVRVLPGACSILNRASGQTYQAYAARLPSADDVAIAATDASGGRSDLIVARVEDPHLSGEPWAAPADPKVGPYVFTRVIPNVGSTTTSLQEVEPGQSGIALARIDIPASTGTITQAMVTDLRTLPNPRREDRKFLESMVRGQAGRTLTSSYATYPLSGSEISLTVPEWATHVQVVANLSGVRARGTDGDNVWGAFRIKHAGDVGEVSNFDVEVGNRHETFSTQCVFEGPVSAGDRGTVQTLSVEGKVNGGAATVESSGGTTVAIEVTYSEAPDA